MPDRLARLQATMRREAVDLVAIAPTANMRYMIGFAPRMDERFCALLVGQEGSQLIVPELNADQVEAHTGMNAVRWDDSSGPDAVLAQSLRIVGPPSGAVMAVDDSMRADALVLLQNLANPSTTMAAGPIMATLRMLKSETEIASMLRSAALADRALLAGAALCQPGVTEREVAEEIARHFRSGGAEMVDFTTVASGPNGAYPHHEPGNRRLELGDTIILDIGATLDGYKSDLTRVIQLGDPSDEARRVYTAVLEANRLARAAAVPGARAKDVDRAARHSLEQAGYGPYFVHRTGHGLGMEVHEPPWISSTSDTVLEPGMVFSVEPGVYLPGKFGVRIEDIVVVTHGESHRLTGLDHEMIVKN